MLLKNSKVSMILILVLAVALTGYAADARTKLKPGWNLFSSQQDVEIGREVSKQAESELPMLNDRQVNTYIDSLGRRLASQAPGEKYPYRFRVVNDTSINAFALPGGFIYVNRGAIEAAADEAQIAGVMAHEIGHVALRHGTNQMSKAYLAQAPLAIIGGALGSNSIGGILGQLGVSFAASSILMKYSRDAETQADLMGAQILRDSGYDPNAMVQFFERIQQESRGRAVEFFSDHPNPENRIGNVQREIVRLGGVPPSARTNSAEFQNVKARFAGMSAPRNARGTGAGGRTTNTRNGRPAEPSTRAVTYNSGEIQFQHPDNWKRYGEGSAVTVAPDGGIINGALAYGMLISSFEPDYHGQGRISLEEGTDQLLNDLQRSNPGMRITRSHERIRVGGRQGFLTEASNQSPAGGRETDWIITALSPDGTLYYFVGVAPQNEIARYNRAFEDLIDSVRLR